MSEFPNLFLICLFARWAFFWSYTRESEVGTANCYGLGGPGVESQWRRDVPCPSAHPASCTMGAGFFPGV